MNSGKVYGWKPEAYENVDEVPLSIRHLWKSSHRNHIIVHCTGRNGPDNDLIKEIKYYSLLNDEEAVGGIPTYYYKISQATLENFPYFPFLNQPGYVAPFVLISMDSILSGTVINVRCTAYAKNIQVNIRSDELSGVANFAIVID
ncbi:hypothetical protein ACOME3_005704 [Neoechinorhynchus agilis]